MQIEPSSKCNLRCTYRPVGTELGATGHMDRHVFERFVDDVHRHALLMVLFGWGEPFVCPSVYEMIAYAHAKGVRIVSSTNGHLFVKRAHAEGVVRSGLDALIVSLSGTTQEAYARFRSGKLDTALAGVREIVAQKRALGSRTPHVQLSFIVTDYSERQIPELLELAHSLGVDGLSLKKMNTASVRPDPTRVDDALPEELRYRRFQYGGEDGHVRQRVKHNPCKALWHNPTIRWDGTVNPCIYDFDGTRVLGDVTVERFSEVWSGARYRAMRKEFRRNGEQIEICNRCTYAYAGGNYTDIVADTWLFDDATYPASSPADQRQSPATTAGAVATNRPR